MWVNAAQLANYLINMGYSSVVASDSSIYLGNPVYWINPAGSSASGHQMICTGYNSAGVPVVDGHNPDLYRVPYSNYIGRGLGLCTIQIVTSDQHTHIPKGGWKSDAASHYKICIHCRGKCNTSSHTMVTVGLKRYCSVCNYSGSSASVSCIKSGKMLQ